MGSERRVFLGGFRFFMVAENYCRTKLANKGQVSLPFPPDVSDAQRMPVVHMDANCPPGRARPRNVVARGQVADTLCVDAGEKCLLLALPSARSSMAGRPCTSAMGH